MVARMFVSSFGAFGDGSGSDHPRRDAASERAVGAHGADMAAAVIGQIERSQALDTFAQSLGGLVSTVLPPGKVKDLISGTWMGHPAHPMLTDIPIGAWTSALILDMLGGPAAAKGADALIGIGVLGALPTAITGLSELGDLGTQPERAVAAAHAIGNTVAVGLFAASYVARNTGSRTVGVGLSMAATGIMLAAAFLGGHLSFRKGIGVDHTAFEYPVQEWTPVLDEGELAEGAAKLVSAGGNDVMLYRANGTLRALADRCTHAGGPLHEGSIDGGRVTCPWHASMFNLADGSLVRGPARAPQPSYDTRVQDGRIEVRSRT
jgi:nitrite reductase/ring-hydroxylating ferredoxin subunit/uncharacterized membrane protein